MPVPKPRHDRNASTEEREWPLKWVALALKVFVAAVPLLGLPVSRAAGDNWPQFRGTNAAGVSGESDLPVAWGADKNVRWKRAIPGVGWSSPVVWDDRVFLTTAVSTSEPERPKRGLYFGGDRLKPRDAVHGWEVLCLDRRDGKLLWRRAAAEGKPTSAIHLKNSYASETPATDGQRVYAYFGSAGLYCYDLEGELVWKKQLGSFKTRMGWGTASSPVLDGDRLFVLCDNEEQSFLVALDKRTGDELWRAQRDEKSSWATPFVWHTAGRTELVTCATKRVRSYDPASGKVLWELGGMSMVAAPTPVAAHDLLYVSSGLVLDRNRPLFAIRPGSSGDITLGDDETSNSGVAWCQKQAGPYIPSPVVYGDYIYVLYDLGLLACYDARTGAKVYDKQRLARGSASFSASPWAYDGKIFCLNEDGDTFVIQAGPQFKLLGTNSLDEMFMASPAISAGSLFLRGIEHLYCVQQP